MKFRNGLSLLAVALVLGSSGAAYGQAAGGDAPNSASVDDGEIVVTAQKREQNLSDVALTITAATGQQLQTAGVTNVNQLAKIAPGFSVGQTIYGYQVFSVRGINFNSQQFSAPPAVSTYTDEAPIPYTAMTGGLLLDVDHIEVLKGPQGTLFGQNATAGSVNVIAAKPTEDFRAGVNGEVNHFGQVFVNGYVSGPLSETLTARLAAQTTQGGAWQKGYYLNRDKNGSANKGAARLLLNWKPTERLNVMLNLNGNYDHGEGQQPTVGFVSIANAASPWLDPRTFTYPESTNNRDGDISPGFDTHVRRSLLQAVLRADYELTDSLKLTSITNFIRFRSRTPIDYDGTAIDNSISVTRGDDDTFSQELRLAGNVMDGKLNFILGGNYSHDKIVDNLFSAFPGYSPLPVDSYYEYRGNLTARSIAAFGNVDFEIAPRLTLTGGLRYTKARQTTDGCSYGGGGFEGVFAGIAGGFRAIAGLGPLPAGSYAPDTCNLVNDNVPKVQNPNGPGLIPDYLPIYNRGVQNEENVSWRAGINFKPSEGSLIYALVSRGFKAGVFPSQANLLNSQLAAVKQEKLTSFEVGVKGSALDGAIKFSASAFHYDYRDKQFFTFVPVSFLIASVIVNIPKSRVNGFDIEATIKPTENLTLRGAVTYIDTQIGKFSAYDYTGGTLDVSYTEFNNAPPWSGTFDAEYRIPTNSGHAYLGVGGEFRNRTFTFLGEQATSIVPGYVVLDARIGYVSDKGWRVGAFARNFTDKYYYLSIFPAGDVYAQFNGAPRTFGVSAGINF